MADYLQGYLSILPESQRQKLLSYINKDQDISGKSDEELTQATEDIIEKIGQATSIMQYREMAGRSNSAEYNSMMAEIYTDLLSLYTESTNIDRVITNNHALNNSILASLHKQLAIIERKLDSLNVLADNNEGFTSAKKESFVDESLYQNYIDSLYVDKDGYKYPVRRMADVVGGALVLSSVPTGNICMSSTMEILQQTGEAFRGDNVHQPAMAIDGSDATFWAEVILVDEPINVDMPDLGVDRGAICQFKITFPQASVVNTISLKPYTEFPLEIVSIGYVVDDGDTISGYIDISNIYKTNTLETTDASITERVNIRFPSVSCKGLIFTLRQLHAIVDTYEVTKDEMNNKEMWSKILNAEAKITLNDIYVAEEGKANPLNPQLPNVDEYDPAWANYLELRHDVDKDAVLMGCVGFSIPGLAGAMGLMAFNPAAMMTGFIIGSGLIALSRMDKPERQQVKKYEYVYGAYDISAMGNTYDISSCYVSIPHEVTGNVQTVALESHEIHPTFKGPTGSTIVDAAGDSLRRTSVEYYISPGSDVWIPILPLDQETVKNELLLFTDMTSKSASLRWEIDSDENFYLYRDEVCLTYLNDYEISADKRSIIIKPWVWSPSSSFTIDYTPTGNPYEINFDPAAGLVHPKSAPVEYFNGTDRNCSITLRHYPYVDLHRLKDEATYNPVAASIKGAINVGPRTISDNITSVRDRNTALPAVGCRLLNVTDYSSSEIPAMNLFDPKSAKPTIEYLQDGNKIYFTETFSSDLSMKNFGIDHGSGTIAMAYDYLVSDIRVKVILRRTNASDNGVTPELLDYTLKSRCLT